MSSVCPGDETMCVMVGLNKHKQGKAGHSCLVNQHWDTSSVLIESAQENPPGAGLVLVTCRRLYHVYR